MLWSKLTDGSNGDVDWNRYEDVFGIHSTSKVLEVAIEEVMEKVVQEREHRCRSPSNFHFLSYS
jgi:hypothetical protein